MVVLVAVIVLVPVAGADDFRSIASLGHGTAIVFSPDLSVATNCSVYRRLGFECYQSPDWDAVLRDIRRRNESLDLPRIALVILETHGTNGNGLKIQDAKDPSAERSYIAVGALQERLADAGVQYCILSACNARRLLRPEIYNKLNPNGDRLFLPPTLGVIEASCESPTANVKLLARGHSHVESLSFATTLELSKATRQALSLSNHAVPFVVSDLLMQIVTRDPALDLCEATPTDDIDRSTPEDAVAEVLFRRFVAHLDKLATSSEVTPIATTVRFP